MGGYTQRNPYVHVHRQCYAVRAISTQYDRHPSVCLSVHCGFQGQLYERILIRNFVPSDTFLYRLATKLTEKRVEENANVSFFETDNRACTGPVTFCYSLTS